MRKVLIIRRYGMLKFNIHALSKGCSDHKNVVCIFLA